MALFRSPRHGHRGTNRAIETTGDITFSNLTISFYSNSFQSNLPRRGFRSRQRRHRVVHRGFAARGGMESNLNQNRPVHQHRRRHHVAVRARRGFRAGTYFPITTFRLCDCPYETDTFGFYNQARSPRASFTSGGSILLKNCRHRSFWRTRERLRGKV